MKIFFWLHPITTPSDSASLFGWGSLVCNFHHELLHSISKFYANCWTTRRILLWSSCYTIISTNDTLSTVHDGKKWADLCIHLMFVVLLDLFVYMILPVSSFIFNLLFYLSICLSICPTSLSIYLWSICVCIYEYTMYILYMINSQWKFYL